MDVDRIPALADQGDQADPPEQGNEDDDLDGGWPFETTLRYLEV